MTTGQSIGWIRATSLRGTYYFVSFTGRYTYGWPETLTIS